MCEAGLVGSCLTWTRVQPALAACGLTSYAYDRRGLGWSGPASGVPSIASMVDDLRRVVQTLAIRGPYVIVAHSFGAFVARVYAHRYPEEVCGLVLVDPALPEDWCAPTRAERARLRRAWGLSQLARWLASVGVVRLGLWALTRRGGGRVGPLLGLSSTCRRLAAEIAKMPRENAQCLMALWSDPAFFRTLSMYAATMPSRAREAAQVPWPSGCPVTVLTGAHQTDMTRAQHRAIAQTHVVVADAEHWIPLDRPDCIAAATREIARLQPDFSKISRVLP